MNTYFGLLAEFDGRAEIPLDEVAPRYFGLNARTASIRANAQALPVPVYRAGDSQKVAGQRRGSGQIPGREAGRGTRSLAAGERVSGRPSGRLSDRLGNGIRRLP